MPLAEEEERSCVRRAKKEGAKSNPGKAGRELEKRAATLAPAVTDLSIPAWRWQERSSCRCHGCHLCTARSGAPVRREEERERATSLEFPRSCGLGSQGCCTATSRQRGEPPPVPSPHATPRSWRYRGLRPGRAPGRAAGAVSSAPAPPRPGSCQLFGRSLCRRLPRTPARAETGHGQLLNSAIGRAKARHIRARESGDRPGWRNERGAKAREGVTGKASLQNAELAACRESGEHCSANSQGRGHEGAA
ncbi:uncharacterized protein LOC117010397 [Catharus ustulatus]|uniref:uncharacterized protein LOC117010397 n=1 Tax=Catharus ustulatus TaxID=91951 RepID=UPI00140C9F49|nr:uncharacterized protein LOC117010397 [Catharus ustulatus]